MAGLILQLRNLWGRLSRIQQMALIGVAGGAIVFTFIMLNMGGQQSYVTAFTNLDPKDSAATIEQLAADKIPYQTNSDGTTIKVPAANLADARLKLAAKGLPQGGAVGFELFDKTSFGVTDFVQHLNYQRALEGELGRTIGTLAQVENARVHIVVPKQELFVSQQKPATASVVLRMRAGRSLDDNALKGISHMIARSVEGLEEKNITVLDTTGRLLFDGGQGSTGAGLSSTQIEVQTKLEKGLESQAQTLLDQVVGANRSAVRVRADMDFSQEESLNETYTPGGAGNQGVPRSTAQVQETFSGTGSTSSQPGAAVNVAGARNTVGAGGGDSTYQRQETTTNYEVSKNVTKTVKSPGQLKRLSISVLLDGSISEADASGLRDAIGAAVGFDQKRGDQLVVTTAAFSGNQPETVTVMKPSPLAPMLEYARMAVPLLAALVVLFVLWRMSRSVSPKRPRTRVMDGQLALPAGALNAYQLAAAGGDELEDFDTVLLGKPQETPEQARRRTEISNRLSGLARSNPDSLVEIMHGWMSQDDKRK
jgi:flagellar M-ring protein FliF